MPNHVTNLLRVSGPAAEVDKMKYAVGNGPDKIDAQRILPMPFELRIHNSPPDDPVTSSDLMKKYGAGDWYQWCIQNWGTKWGMYDYSEWKRGEVSPLAITAGNCSTEDAEDAEDADVDEVDDEIGFQTAWSSPIRVFSVLANFFPKLQFTLYYAEPGNAFAGVAEWRDGELQGEVDYGPEDTQYGAILLELGMEHEDDYADSDSADHSLDAGVDEIR